MRRLAAIFVWSSDEFLSLMGEMTHGQLAADPAAGGLGPDDMTGPFSDLTREDVLAFAALLDSLLSPLTSEQRALFYRLKDSRRLGMGPGMGGLLS
jgi:hypothetical protein